MCSSTKLDSLSGLAFFSHHPSSSSENPGSSTFQTHSERIHFLLPTPVAVALVPALVKSQLGFWDGLWRVFTRAFILSVLKTYTKLCDSSLQTLSHESQRKPPVTVYEAFSDPTPSVSLQLHFLPFGCSSRHAHHACLLTDLETHLGH